LLNFCVGQLLKKNPDQVADAASDMAGLSIKDPEPVPGIWGSFFICTFFLSKL
jgi:hypothetical protein